MVSTTSRWTLSSLWSTATGISFPEDGSYYSSAFSLLYVLTVCSAVFQAGGLVVIVVEIFRRNFLASMVPVIVNAILNEHQLVIDIVSFVQKGDFHRSRLGEKQRGKILAGWVTRKMRTIAQYSIRDPNGSDAHMISEEPGAGRVSMSGSMLGMGRMEPASLKASSTRAPSLLGMTATMNSLSLSQQQQQQQQQQPQPGQQPSAYYQSIPENPPSGQNQGVELHDPSDRTPTDNRMSFLPNLQIEQGGPMDHSSLDRSGPFNDEGHQHQPGNYQNAYHPQQQQYQSSGSGLSGQVPDILRPGPADEGNGSGTWNGRDFYSDSTPYHSYDNTSPDPNMQSQQQQQQNQQTWRMESQHNQGYDPGYSEEVTRYASHGSYDSRAGGGNGGGGGGLRVANRDSTASESEDDSWRRDVLAQMNFAGVPGGGAGEGSHAQ
jgi:hypothetical protein